jgi:excisionase family DNA binding protein
VTEQLRTVDALAKRYLISRMTIYRAIHAGALPALRMGRWFRVKQEDFDKWWEENRTWQ